MVPDAAAGRAFMKIDKSRPSHWWCLACFGFQVSLALVLRVLGIVRRGKSREVVLYGHKLNGNLRALYQKMQDDFLGLVPVFVTMDRAYCRHLRDQGVRCQLATRMGCSVLLARTVAVVSDHGLHVMQLLLGQAGLRFFDVWHGIPFKGFDADDFRIQHRYDEIWVSSPTLREIYIRQFGFDPARVVATGYGRTDVFVRPNEDAGQQTRASLNLEGHSRVVLFAPTWRQDDASRDIYPFGQSESLFLNALAEICESHGATLLVRKHLNSNDDERSTRTNVRHVPSSQFTDTEAILAISDILILDWSSIAFDFLLLNRPTIFLDVPPPFKKGFSVGPECRFGDIVGDMPGLLDALNSRLANASSYMVEHRGHHQSAKTVAYGELADGKAAMRYLERLSLHFLNDESFR